MIKAILLFPLLPLMTLFEIVKRVIFLFVYLMAYCTRDWPRKQHDFLWLALDDSIVLDSLARIGVPLEYCSYGKREPLGFITENMPSGRFREFMRAWNWGAVRNNGINLRDVLAVGLMKEQIWRFGKGKSFYAIRRFKHFALPYLELWPAKDFRIQCGWLSGAGFFQVQVKKYP